MGICSFKGLAKKKKEFKRWLQMTVLPVKKNKIVFSQFGGKGYGCNPKAICEEFRKRGGDYDLVWLCGSNPDRKKQGIPKDVRIASDKDSLYELMTAKVWINNIHFQKLYDSGLKKRKGTIYLNTFHGGITLKNEGKDKHSYKEQEYAELSQKEKNYRLDSDYVDYVTCGCDMERHVLEEFFYGKGEILKLGDARTDVLIGDNSKAAKKVRKKYKVSDDTKLVIYAPTFRADMKLHWYDLNYEEILDTLEEVYGGKWKMLIRLHPRLAGKTKQIIPKSDRFINAASYLDMQELAAACDMMISDYSSVITDFLLTGKPAFMYVPDLDKYLKNRGMYFSMEELPYSYARTTEELIEILRNFDADLYAKKAEAFLDSIDYIRDGKSAERIVDFIIDKIK